MVDQEFGLMDEVSTWTHDLEALKTIKDQRYQILVGVYMVDELDKIYEWIEVLKGNEVIMGFYEKI